MQRLTTVGGLSILVILVAVAAQASSITLHGSDTGAGAVSWRTDSVAKSADVDANNVYGTDGYAMWDVRPGTGNSFVPSDYRDASLPGYVSAFAESSDENMKIACFGFYPAIDYPSKADYYAPVLTDNAQIAGDTADMATFTVDADVADVDYFVFGCMSDVFGLGKEGYCSNKYKLTGSGGGSLEVDVSGDLDGTPDMYFFKVEGATAGEVFTFSVTQGDKGFCTAGPMSWDSVTTEVPEPSTLVLLLGGLALLVFRRVR